MMTLLDSMLTPAGLVAQASALFLVIAMLGSRMRRVRIGVMIAAGLAMIHALFFVFNPLAAFWAAMLLIVNVGVIARIAYSNARIRFTPDEEPMLKKLLAGLERARARHFLDQGFWLSGQKGETLIREGEPVTHLFYLAAGQARVMSAGKAVGWCRPGDLIGEVTVLSGDAASATVVLDGPARFWCAPAKTLRLYLDAHHDVRHAVELSFAAALRHKLREANKVVADAGGLAA